MGAVAKVEEEILTTQDACKLLKVTRQTLYKLVESGDIQAERVGRGYRFRREDLLPRKTAVATGFRNDQEGTEKDSVPTKVWELKGNFSTAGIRRMAKRTFQELAANVEEIIVNAYDADATIVEVIVDHDQGTLSIYDDGSGMTESELESYVVYGESGKTSTYRSSKFQRAPIGEYGMGGKLAISNLSYYCRVVTWRDGKQHALSMDSAQLENAKYLSDVRHKVITTPCDPERHGTAIYMSRLHYKHVDSDRLIERLSMKMPCSQSFTIWVTVKENGKSERKQISEPRFDTVKEFRYEARLKDVGQVKLEVFYTTEPIPATKQGIWTKVNGRIVNEKQEWFGLLNLHSGNRYRWRLYGYGYADGLKESVTFSKNDFVAGPEYREYYNWVATRMKEVQDTLLAEDEHAAEQKEKNLVKDVENSLNRWLKKLNEPEVQNRLSNKIKEEALSEPPADDAQDEDILQVPMETPLGSAIDEVLEKRSLENHRRRNAPPRTRDQFTYKGKGYKIETVDMSETGDLVKFTKDASLIEINDRHPLYVSAAASNSLHVLVRDVAMMEIAIDIGENDPRRFQLIYNQLASIAGVDGKTTLR